MNTAEIIKEFKKFNVVPRLEGDLLKLSGETDTLPKEFIDKVRSGKNELIAFLKDIDQATFAAIPSIQEQENYPASNAQKRIWMLSQFEGGSSAYNIVASFYFKGVVIKEKLSSAFHSSIRRHESLRTVFKEIDGELRQVIVDNSSFEIVVEDICDINNVKDCLKSEIVKASQTKFDLENGPLLNVKLLQLSDSKNHSILPL